MKQLLFILVIVCFTNDAKSQATLLWSNDFEVNEINYFEYGPQILPFQDSIWVYGRKQSTQGDQLQLTTYDYSGTILDSLEIGLDSVSNNEIIDHLFDSKLNCYILQRDYLAFYKSRMLLQKYDSTGTLLWVSIVENSADTSYFPKSLDLLNDSIPFISYYLEYDYPNGPGDVVLTTSLPHTRAYDSSGVLKFDLSFLPSELTILGDFSYSNRTILGSNDSMCFFGRDEDLDYNLIKVAQDGVKAGYLDINLPNGSSRNYISNDGGFLSLTSTAYRLSKLENTGAVIWQNETTTFLPSNVSGDEITCLIQDSDGNSYVTGRHYGDDYYGPLYSNADILTTKYDVNGVKVWENRFEYGTDYNNADIGEVIALKNGFVYVGGLSQEEGQGSDSDYIILKIDSADGSLVGGYRYDSPWQFYDVVTDIVIMDNDDIVLTGLSGGIGGYQWTTQRLTNIALSQQELTGQIEIRVFPNPSDGGINILTSQSGVLQIFDVQGNLVFETEISENEKLDLSHFNSGLYLLRFEQANSETFHQKLVIK